MKRIVCSLLLVVLMTVMLAPAVFAAGTSVVVSSEIVNPGDEVVLDVTMTGNTGFGSGKYTVSYDSAVLTLVDLDVSGKLLDGATVNDEKGVISFAKTTSVSEDGVLFTAKFAVAENAASGEYEVAVAVQDVVNAETKEPVEVASVAGKITVHECEWEWVVDKEATETETGLKHEECKHCGETRNEETVIDKLGDSTPIPPTGDNTVALMAVVAIIGVATIGGVCISRREFSK